MTTTAPASSPGFVVVLPKLHVGVITLFVPWPIANATPHGFPTDVFGTGIATVGDVLTAISEPVSRPPTVHEYSMTPYSLGGAVARHFTADRIVEFLAHFCVNPWPTVGDGDDPILRFVRGCMASYRQARAVVTSSGCYVECVDRALADTLRRDPIILSMCPPNSNIADIPPLQASRAGETEDVRCTVVFPLIDAGAAKIVADRCLTVHGIPLRNEYDSARDGSLPPMHLILRSSTRPREYQIRAVEAVVGTGMCSSGVVVLPCGAGKTLVGIMLLCAVRRPAVILCASSVSVEQWKNQVLEFAAFDQQAEANDIAAELREQQAQQAATGRLPLKAKPLGERATTRIACFTGKQKDKVTENTRLIITTYSMLATAHRSFVARSFAAKGAATGGAGVGSTRSSTQQRSRAAVDALFRPEGWGLILLDEAHVVPADFFREALAALKAKSTVGLTATFVREDQKIMDLHHLVGPKLFDASWEELRAQGFLADVTCIEMHCRMTREFGVEYWNRSSGAAALKTAGRSNSNSASATTREVSPVLVSLAASNPSKMVCTLALVQRHWGSKTIVFCDFIELLKRYAAVLKCPVVHGDTPHTERLKIFSDFESTGKVNVILVSRVGDVSVNLPSASVVIQVSSHGGSRRQEAQRLGRILRPKPKNADGTSVHAYFYSLVSDDTLETRYAAHRTAFLVDQGYMAKLASFDVDAAMEELESAVETAVANGADSAALAVAATAALAAAKECIAEDNRLTWLSRVVSHWELGHLQRELPAGLTRGSVGTAKRRSARGAADDDDDDSIGYTSSDGGDDDSSASDSDGSDAGRRKGKKTKKRGAAVVKNEEDGDAGPQRAPRQPTATKSSALSKITTGGDDVVYHEFY